MVLDTMVGQKKMDESQIDKCERAVEDLLQYMMTDVEVDDNNLPFTLVDYFCITSVKPNELLSYIRTYKSNMGVLDRRILCTYLGKNIDLGMNMTREKVASEKLSYIIEGEIKEVTKEMWEEIFVTFEKYNIPTNRGVMSPAARRMVYGYPILPLLEKKDKTKQFLK